MEEQQAIDCEASHYKIDQIIGVKYSPGKKCPTMIQVQIFVGDDMKDVMYQLEEDGWGTR
ncbi:hypothetical protein D3C74_392600 [compost metagenome]